MWHDAVMSTDTYRKAASPSDIHCDLCGRLTHGEHDEGYTLCCNELICYGDGGCITIIITEPGGWADTIHFRNTTDADDFIASDLSHATEAS